MRLARTLPFHLLPIHAPRPPDHTICSPVYGTRIDPSDCEVIIDTYWPSGKTPIHYYLNQPAPSNSIVLPVVSTSSGWESSCRAVIEPAGPVHRRPPYLSLSPDMIRGLAGYLIQTCAYEQSGMGGFVTVGLEAAERYLQGGVDAADPGRSKNHTDTDPRPNGAYVTISILGKNQTRSSPGDTDPDIAGYLSKYAALCSELYNEHLASWQAVARFLRYRAMSMVRGAPGPGVRAWWDATGFEAFSWQNGRLFYVNGASRIRQGSMPDSGHSDGTNLGGPWKQSGSGDDQDQPQGGAGNGGSDEDGQDESAAEGAGEMTYLCDTSNPSSLAPVSKGTTAPGIGPDPIDCEKLSWSGLPGSSNPSSLLTLENPSSSPMSNSSIGKPQFFTHGTCTLAVFATNDENPSSPSKSSSGPLPSAPASGTTMNGVTTISWVHIIAAFETLTNLCVANPLYPSRSRGGVACWSQQGQGVGSWIHGKRRRRFSRKRSDVKRGRKARRNAEEKPGDVEDGDMKHTLAEHVPFLAVGGKVGKRDGVDGVDGAMALPKGVNVTVYRTGSETIPNGLESVMQCDSAGDVGGQLQKSQNVSSCGV